MAGQRVSDICELLEAVLLDLPVKQLFTTAPLVCRQWRRVIQSSSPLKRRRFFSPRRDDEVDLPERLRYKMPPAHPMLKTDQEQGPSERLYPFDMVRCHGVGTLFHMSYTAATRKLVAESQGASWRGILFLRRRKSTRG
ncbi:hypothetical protein K431DRAFT_303163 [Polychaeton citri CBS 116435]|uniref:F-box domain-containing protein n=1 Tax=Polychaeton citri CBS 116435 TaxID=1314669 RepID=A0A9P4Q756_9PEZI|nr:hypothetical protein K431DRAFT_303163 [Polychaeton citri CBS 116435]